MSGDALEILSKSKPKIIAWYSNGATNKYIFPNHSPTLNGVERTISVINITIYFNILHVLVQFSGLQWSDCVAHSLTKLWVAPVSTKVSIFNPLTIVFTKQSPSTYSLCGNFPWPFVLNSCMCYTNISMTWFISSINLCTWTIFSKGSGSFIIDVIQSSYFSTNRVNLPHIGFPHKIIVWIEVTLN